LPRCRKVITILRDKLIIGKRSIVKPKTKLGNSKTISLKITKKKKNLVI